MRPSSPRSRGSPRRPRDIRALARACACPRAPRLGARRPRRAARRRGRSGRRRSARGAVRRWRPRGRPRGGGSPRRPRRSCRPPKTRSRDGAPARRVVVADVDGQRDPHVREHDGVVERDQPQPAWAEKGRRWGCFSDRGDIAKDSIGAYESLVSIAPGCCVRKYFDHHRQALPPFAASLWSSRAEFGARVGPSPTSRASSSKFPAVARSSDSSAPIRPRPSPAATSWWRPVRLTQRASWRHPPPARSCCPSFRPKRLSVRPSEVRRVIGQAGTGVEPLVVIVEAAEELREAELAALLSAASHTSRAVILRIIRDG